MVVDRKSSSMVECRIQLQEVLGSIPRASTFAKCL